MVSDAPPSRRTRLRAQVAADILDSARVQLTAHGPEGLSLRAIARDLDMGVSSLYRYFPSRDDLLTELLVEAFDSQADAVAEASVCVDDPVEALRAGMLAYRDWSLAHPAEFALAYGTPVPGFQAPADRTVRAGVRVGGIVIDLLTQAWRQDRLDPMRVAEREAALTLAEREGLNALISRRGYAIPAGVMSLAIDMLVRIHGFVVMEAFGQLRPLAADPRATFERTIDEAAADSGLR